MAPEWIYLLKVNVGITLFYAFYKLLCQRDTFFLWRRIAILSFLGISFVYPLLNIQEWVNEQPVFSQLTNYYTALATEEITIIGPHIANSPRLPEIMTIAMYIYATGVILLGIRFLIQLLSIIRIRRIGQVVYLNGQRIISLPTESNPFSFFGWIFLYLPQLQEDNRDEILMHEQTHARQWHSVDVLLCETICIICWFNPFIWLLKTEMRLNLEYLADDKVTGSMHNHKQYQYHLLGLAYTDKKNYLYNNFNVSHLRKRIIMMNKKRTRMTGRIKYALFAPLAIALLMVSNIGCTSNEKQNEATESPAPVIQMPEPTSAIDTVYSIAEENPEFPGGMAECYKWIGKELQYPTTSAENGIQGRVVVSFVVNTDGSISDAKVIRGVDPHLDKEALRVISKMPKWTPGKQNGKPVRCAFNLPLRFKLN